MTKQTKFKFGDYVKPSGYGISMNIFPGGKTNQFGIVTYVDEFGIPMIVWKGRKHPHGYHPSFLRKVLKP